MGIPLPTRTSHQPCIPYTTTSSNVVRPSASQSIRPAARPRRLRSPTTTPPSTAAAMAGLGTKDKLLVNRVVRIHWDRAHKDQVKRAYQHRYKRDLIARVQGETSGDYRELLVALLR